MYTIDEKIITREAFDYKISIVYDETPDTSYLGQFTNEWQDGAIISNDVLGHGVYGRFYVSLNHLPHNPEAWRHVTDETKKDLIAEYGSLSNADRHYAIQDMERLVSLYNNEWHYIGVIVTATIEGIELSSDSLWGVEGDSSEDYIDEIIEDCIAEARAAAKEKLDKLKNTQL